MIAPIRQWGGDAAVFDPTLAFDDHDLYVRLPVLHDLLSRLRQADPVARDRLSFRSDRNRRVFDVRLGVSASAVGQSPVFARHSRYFAAAQRVTTHYCCGNGFAGDRDLDQTLFLQVAPSSLSRSLGIPDSSILTHSVTIAPSHIQELSRDTRSYAGRRS